MRKRNERPIAALATSAWTGVVIFEVLHGIDDYVRTAYSYSEDGYTGYYRVGRNKVRYDSNGNPYFEKDGGKYLLSDFMRI